MIHALLTRLATRPDLLAEHAGAYAELVAAETEVMTQRWRRRAALSAAAAGRALLFLGLAGMATLLAAALPLATMPEPWLLLVVPAAPLLGAVGCTVALQRTRAVDVFPHLRDQLAADVRLLRASPDAEERR